ncbi:MAG: lasso peptide biosynthesis B2 protein [Nitrospira defluvii]|nr:lasso peptide biosynthesis B2 protein [Nitrospira defluvii]
MIAGTGLVVVAIRLALRMVSLPRLLSWLTCKPAVEDQDRMAMEDVAYYVERWLALAPYNPKGNCFPRALTLYWFARRAGFPVQFQCGVLKLNESLDGHAWLMLDGREFFEPSPHWRSFTVTVAFPQVPVPLNNQPSDSP